MPLYWLKEGEVTAYAPRASEVEPSAPVGSPGLDRLQQAWATFADPAGRQTVDTVEPIMTRSVVWVAPDATLAEAQRLLDIQGIRHLPVLEDGSVLVGLLGDRDILRAQAAGVDDDLPVSRAMNRHVLTASPDTAIAECLETMLAYRIGCIPVLNGPRRTLLGLVTNTDLLRAVVSDAPVDVWI